MFPKVQHWLVFCLIVIALSVGCLNIQVWHLLHEQRIAHRSLITATASLHALLNVQVTEIQRRLSRPPFAPADLVTLPPARRE